MSTEEGWDSEDWREFSRLKREESMAKRAANRQSSADMLKAAGIEFESRNNGAHLIVGNVDFWPGTGLWIDHPAGKRGRGVRRLLKHLGR